MARPLTTTDNRYTQAFLSSYVSFHDESLPSQIDDIIRGSKGQMDSSCTNKVQSQSIFVILQSLSEVSTTTVGDLMNRKRRALGDADLSKRMIEYYTKVARCASQGIYHHIASYGLCTPPQVV